MFNLFKRRPKPTVIVPLDQRGPFHAVWTKQRQPSPGMMTYSYGTLGLAPTSPIDHAVAVRMQINATQPLQPVVTNAVQTMGVPLVAGQIFGQPLFDPNAGYTDPVTGLNNVPYNKFGQAPAGVAI